MLDIAILSGFLGPAADIIQKLKEEKIISHEGLVIYHEEDEIEYRLDLSLGDQKLRTTTLKNFLKSSTLQKITINALEATGIGMNGGENLKELGLLSWNNDKLTIDFPQIFKTINSNLVVLKFRTRSPSNLKDHLVYRQIHRTTSLQNEKIVSNFEIVLDYASMWHSKYTSFSVRNILFTINPQLDPDSLNQMLGEYTQKLEKADKMALTEKNARNFLTEFQKTLIELQEPKFLDRLKDVLEIKPSINGRVINIIPSLRVYTLQHSQLSLTIPYTFTYSISSNIEDRQVAIHGEAIFDLVKYDALLKEKIKSFITKNGKLKF